MQGRNLRPPSSQGCRRFTCVIAELPWHSFCAVSACTLQCLNGAVLKNRSSGADVYVHHKLCPCKGTKCAGSLFCKKIIFSICGSVYRRILNISLMSSWWWRISLFLLCYKLRSQWTLESCFSFLTLGAVILPEWFTNEIHATSEGTWAVTDEMFPAVVVHFCCSTYFWLLGGNVGHECYEADLSWNRWLFSGVGSAALQE